MTDLLLFKNIDEPDLHTIEVYERRGEEPLPDRQLKRLKCADPNAPSQA